MPCPFTQLIFNGDDNECDDDDNSIIDGIFVQTTPTVNSASNHHEVIEEPLNYTSYLRVDILLSALKCLSHTDPADNTSPHVHDEHFFILIHQGM